MAVFEAKREWAASRILQCLIFLCAIETVHRDCWQRAPYLDQTFHRRAMLEDHLPDPTFHLRRRRVYDEQARVGLETPRCLRGLLGPGQQVVGLKDKEVVDCI